MSGKFEEFSPDDFMQSKPLILWLSGRFTQMWYTLLIAVKISCIIFFFKSASRHVLSGELSPRRNVVVSWSICVHLCSQGPHLWPFISSQVKGLRDSDAHTDRQGWTDREELTDSCLSTVKKSTVLNIDIRCDNLTWKKSTSVMYKCVRYIYCELFSHTGSVRPTRINQYIQASLTDTEHVIL